VACDPAGAQDIFARFTAESMWTMVTGNSTQTDLAVYQDAEFETAYRQALEEGFAQGPAGYARDTVLAMGRWPFNLAVINIPVNRWTGDKDSGHSPDNGARLAARTPGARRHVVPGIGGTVLWTHAKPILLSLLT